MWQMRDRYSKMTILEKYWTKIITELSQNTGNDKKMKELVQQLMIIPKEIR